MSLIDEIAGMAARMESEQITLKEAILNNTTVRVSDDTIDGMDRLIYNHCLNKKALADLLGKSRNTLSKILSELEQKELISAPINQNKNHLYTRFDVANIMEALKLPTYRDYNNPVVIVVENHKGGTGKSTTTVTLAVAAALDLHLNARICVVDFDPQGTIGNHLIRNASDGSIYLTMADVLLKKHEPNKAYAEYINGGFAEEEIICNMPFQTHLPNLHVIPAFPADERFTDKYWAMSDEEKLELITRFKEVVVPALKSKYDLILIDTPPQDSPLIWAANEGADGILVPLTPREYDFASTTNYMKTMSKRLVQLPSKGQNLKWLKVLAVNVDDKSQHEMQILQKLARTAQDKFLSTNIKSSEAFKAAAGTSRTVLDIKKSEDMCPSKQFDIAEISVRSVYQQFITEIRTFSAVS
ncbi:AAA family ATPase [Serratia symbiotica]|uniref:AAA family ATPase n=1 Tax=Serratia symbiotica TaxID=138074 RepID=UPI001322976D|nr:AAA family ATPase [Serratia symbiotica]QTP13317.1 AAA family ATPase [Serratia symbiotica]